jgi:hypothetical protein
MLTDEPEVYRPQGEKSRGGMRKRNKGLEKGELLAPVKEIFYDFGGTPGFPDSLEFDFTLFFLPFPGNHMPWSDALNAFVCLDSERSSAVHVKRLP